jgi:dephospho-CoA kinase
MRYVLIGPPGVGKSTVVRALHGLDLEAFPQSRRMEMLQNTEFKYYGAADTAHLQYPDDCVKVLLWLPEREYFYRRLARDSMNLAKASQRPQMIRSYLKYADYVVDASGTVKDVVTRIRNSCFTTNTSKPCTLVTK